MKQVQEEENQRLQGMDSDIPIIKKGEFSEIADEMESFFDQQPDLD